MKSIFSILIISSIATAGSLTLVDNDTDKLVIRSTINGCIKTLDILSEDPVFKKYISKYLHITKEDNVGTVAEKINMLCGQVPYRLGY